MRLLVYDPEHISHSTDVVRMGLLPELARRADRLVWMLPESRHSFYTGLLAEEPAIELTGFAPGKSDPRRWLDGMLRRLENPDSRNPGGTVTRFRRRLQAQAAARKAREMNAAWIFCPSFMNQPVPKSAVPLAGMIYDVSPTLAAETLDNMDRWVTAARVTFCISEFTRQQVSLRLPEPACRRLRVTPLCPPAMKKPSTRTLPKNPGSAQPGRLRVLCPAALTERKGQALLLEAARRCRAHGAGIELVFSGSGTESLNDSPSGKAGWHLAACAAYRSFVDTGGLARALGHVNDDEMEDLFDEADVIVFPSLYEGFGLPVAEAVQRGIPVIASDLPPVREQLDLFECHGRVRLTSPGNVEQLAGALIEFLEGRAPVRINPAEMTRHFERWTWGHLADAVLRNLA